ncbi:hypothetical protein [Sporosarcina sp. P1]
MSLSIMQLLTIGIGEIRGDSVLFEGLIALDAATHGDDNQKMLRDDV